ncbi:hypothetical protein F4774DRAFT_407187 [Daldinia eschscholtzii]|nr:hypothetical protein F4774DRAFT_407187 [Daldinia eschscholtzii]
MPALPSHLAASRDIGDSDACLIKVPNGQGDAPIDIDDGNICIQYHSVNNNFCAMDAATRAIFPHHVCPPTTTQLGPATPNSLVLARAPNSDAHHDPTTQPDEVAIYTGFKNGTIHNDAEVYGIIAIIVGGLVLVGAVSVIIYDRCKRCFHRHEPDEE